MATIELDLNALNAEELAALQVAVRRHVSAAQNSAILDAGFTNCGFNEFNALRMEVTTCHDARNVGIKTYFSNTLKRSVTVPEE